MDETTRRSVLGIAGAVVVGALVALAGSDGGSSVGGVAVFAICGAVAFVINWLVFIPSNAARTEKYYDLTGSVTYLTVTLLAVALSENLDLRAGIVAVMVIVWAARLGTFLFLRIRRAGSDTRFDEIKTSPLRFFAAWTIQGLWVLLTAAAALAIITTSVRRDLGWLAYTGIVVWVVGFAIEVAADRQKSSFKRDPGNEGRFIATGLWAWSRHPNYFGEITLWTGMALLAIPVLSGWQWVVLVSPLFVTLLLTRISGIPMLEAKADERWGDEPEYRQYKASTSVLIPWPPR
jgi:steroid 5-alpha reductase family enzyme